MTEEFEVRVLDPAGVVVSNSDIAGGEPIFRGTRVPVATLFSYLEDGGHSMRSWMISPRSIARTSSPAARGAQPRCRAGFASSGGVSCVAGPPDENVPIRLHLWLEGIEVTTAEFTGWKGIRNGELLRRARAAGYTVLITADRRLACQPRSWAPLACVFVTSQKPARLRPASPASALRVSRPYRGR